MMQSLEIGDPDVNGVNPVGVTATRVVTRRKKTGAHFTPPELAAFLAQEIVNAMPVDSLESIRVLDPACGDGELLLAFANQLPTHVLPRTLLSGVELDSAAIGEARQRLDKLPLRCVRLWEADFLTIAAAPRQHSLFDPLPVQPIELESMHAIIANPPYVRTQVLGAKKAQELAASFALSGRVDLYQAFLVAMTTRLAPGGILGVITSNRFLSTKSGSSVRALLDREYDIIEIIDLGDTKLFEAAVLPAIFIGRKRPPSSSHTIGLSRQAAQFIRIYEQTNRRLQSRGPPRHAATSGHEKVARACYRGGGTDGREGRD